MMKHHYTAEERDQAYTEAINTFGSTMQSIVALEELSEAQKEICKALRGDYNPHHLAEEVADAFIMLEQIQKMFNVADLVEDIRNHKITRLWQRIEIAKEAQRVRLESVQKWLE